MKMILPHRSWTGIIVLIVLLTCIQTTVSKKRCPIGFNLAYYKNREHDPICYRLKGPETFSEKFQDCAANLYTTKLYYALNITETNLVLWTDYKSLYPGGPFIDWSYTETMGKMLENSENVTYYDDESLYEACVIIDPVTNYTAVNCNEKHYRYCFVKPYVDRDDMSTAGCDDLRDYYRFWSPKPTCLHSVKGKRSSTVRANWRDAKKLLCERRNGSLLSTGWRYANNPMFTSPGRIPTFPLGVIMNTNRTELRFDTASEDDMIPSSEWNLDSSTMMSNNSGNIYGAIHEDFWHLVNASYIFYDVICERPIQLTGVEMKLLFDPEDKFILKLNDTVDEDYISCYTDSETYYPKKINVGFDRKAKVFVLTPEKDGYYWCILRDSKDHLVSESNTALFIREKESLVNNYSFDIKLKAKPNLEFKDLVKHWQNMLEEYIFYATNYIKLFKELKLTDRDTREAELKDFMASHSDLSYNRGDIIRKIRVKRYVYGKSVLLHAEINRKYQAVPAASWDDIDVEYMKPVYYCKAEDSVPRLPLGASTISSDCKTYKCVGDFTKGVQWVISAASGCVPPTPVPLNATVQVFGSVNVQTPTVTPNDTVDNSSESEEFTKRPRPTTEKLETDAWNTTTETWESTTVECETTTETWEMTTIIQTTTTEATYPPEVSETVSTVDTPIFPETPTVVPTVRPEPTTIPPTTTPLPPQYILEQVVQDLENILDNDTVIMVEDIDQTFDKVDGLLEAEENLEIPGNLLHLLDRLGARIDLNGSRNGSAIRNNIALLLADAEPDAPVRGLRIASRKNDQFTENAFEIISEEVNSTHLSSDENEAVVHLPESVANSSRRISFVVFRTDRAFHSEHGYYSVNSRVLSINVENLTEFDSGEVIDIHLSPIIADIERNISRSCAYWHFNEDGTGFWSQEGCTFIRSRVDGLLDTCRCDHLTHFAEVLVPRAVFSERNEYALEILTIIGCILSIFGLCMVGLTATLFRSWRRDFSNKIWLQLCIAIFFLVLCFLIIVFCKFDHYNIPCMLIGVALHYCVLASFCWMLVAAVLSYRRLVIVFARDASHKLLRASAFSWGAPCAVVGILLSVDPHSYAGQFEEKSPSGAFCYPSGLGLWLAVIAPIAVMLLANWTLFALIVRSVFASRRIQRHGDSNEAVRCASVSCLLVFLFGLPWIFGLFAYNVVAAYLFTLTATFQGFVLFLFFVLGNKKTRDLWLNKLKIKQTRKVPVTSSTYTNRSTAVGYRGDPEGASSIEANSSKPRSLASPDNSRFS